ncbi:very short patch repair endonuclease [Methylobacterium organophilum]|uniref:very short patch repair endonuclease n=1 Tax=Methylobacterium organophilum TaxID=410 RepID=UPI0024B5E991|nr:very short patch repair endonuclease [Methylobacterium organophilum]
MTDVLTEEQRRLNMSRIRGRDTKPEMLIRRGLHRLGFRFRLQQRDLPGKPDLVLPRYRTGIFVHGCFWHDHGCSLCKRPKTRPEFWEAKLTANRARDQRVRQALLGTGWRVLTVWECALRGQGRRPLEEVLGECAAFIVESEASSHEVGQRAPIFEP